MIHIRRIVAALLFLALMAPVLAASSTASAQQTSFDGIPFENPSAVGTVPATPEASPVSGATPEAASPWHGAYLGEPDAPVTMQLYADYQCPHCRSFHTTIEPLLIDDYVRTGKVRLELIDFPIIGIGSLQELTDDSRESVQAAETTMCAGEQDGYMEYREALYEGDLEPNSGALSDENLVTRADEIGLDGDALASCLASGRYEEPVITGMLSGVDKGVQGTPTMMIDGEILRPGSYDELQQMLDEAIQNAS